MKDHFLRVLEQCAPEDGKLQDAIEHALVEGRVKLSGDLDADSKAILSQKDEIKQAYSRFKSEETINVVIALNLGVPITEITSGN